MNLSQVSLTFPLRQFLIYSSDLHLEGNLIFQVPVPIPCGGWDFSSDSSLVLQSAECQERALFSESLLFPYPNAVIIGPQVPQKPYPHSASTPFPTCLGKDVCPMYYVSKPCINTKLGRMSALPNLIYAACNKIAERCLYSEWAYIKSLSQKAKVWNDCLSVSSHLSSSEGKSR